MKRFIYKTLKDHLGRRQISLIVGARQVGKTTLLKQLQAELDAEKEVVHFFSLEDREILELLNESPKNLLQLISRPNKSRRTFVLIDEIQYLEDPSNFLKYHYDKYDEQLKFIVTGSSSFYIDKKFKDSLAGRKRLFELSTLSLKEVLHFKGEDDLVSYVGSSEIPLLIKDRINEYFYEYLIYGGYPEVVLTDNQEEKKLILKELAESYAKKDAMEGQLTYPESYLHILKILAGRSGELLNVNSLTADIKIDNKTINSYLLVMRKSFHINLLLPFHQNISSELRKMPKIYFCDLGMRNTLLNNYSSIAIRKDKGALFENYIFLILKSQFHLDNIKYWRTQNQQEVDFIVQNGSGEQFAYEVKYQCKAFSYLKYKTFMNNYTQIPLSCIDLDSALSL